MDDKQKDRLGKIVTLAKNGVGGEKTTAIKMVKSLCEKYDLEYDDIMSNQQEVSEYTVEFKTKEEEDILCGCIYKYAYLTYDDSILESVYYKKLTFKTTPERYIETINAFGVLKNIYKKEKIKIQAAMLEAFRVKHDLFYSPTEEEWEKINKKKEKKEEDLVDKWEKERLINNLSSVMDDVELHKRLN